MCGRDHIAEYYAALAPDYDRIAGYLDPVAERMRASLKMRLQQFLTGRDVLEVACGTGYWTQAICKTARSVTATDLHPAMITAARARLIGVNHVRLAVEDAYSLEGLGVAFTAAFAHWWWSHVPKARVPAFLQVLHGKLLPGARVVFVDQLSGAYAPRNRHRDRDGNTVEERMLPDGRIFSVIKNVPSREEVEQLLRGVARDLEFRELPEVQSWMLTYTTK